MAAAGSAPLVLAQLIRYAHSDLIERLVLVTTRNAPNTMKAAMIAKPTFSATVVGTSLFAVPSLQRLLASPEHEIMGVVTQPDRPLAS